MYVANIVKWIQTWFPLWQLNNIGLMPRIRNFFCLPDNLKQRRASLKLYPALVINLYLFPGFLDKATRIFSKFILDNSSISSSIISSILWKCSSRLVSSTSAYSSLTDLFDNRSTRYFRETLFMYAGVLTSFPVSGSCRTTLSWGFFLFPSIWSQIENCRRFSFIIL